MHPFGARSSPFRANFAFQVKVCQFGEHETEMVRDAVLDNCYADDYLASVPNQALTGQCVVVRRTVLCRGGFQLTKCLSNSPEVLGSIAFIECVSSVEIM